MVTLSDTARSIMSKARAERIAADERLWLDATPENIAKFHHRWKKLYPKIELGISPDQPIKYALVDTALFTSQVSDQLNLLIAGVAAIPMEDGKIALLVTERQLLSSREQRSRSSQLSGLIAMPPIVRGK